MGLFSSGQKARLKQQMAVVPPPFFEGHEFSLKGSPRHYDDVRAIIDGSGQAKVWFGEALAYERGAGIALYRIRAREFDWLDALYDWWANAERVEPIQFTFHLYLPDNPRYPVLNLRDLPPAEVAAFIRDNAPYVRQDS